MFRIAEVRTRFIDSRPARDACCALRGPSAERSACGEFGAQRIYAVNLLNEPFTPNYCKGDNVLCLFCMHRFRKCSLK